MQLSLPDRRIPVDALRQQKPPALRSIFSEYAPDPFSAFKVRCVAAIVPLLIRKCLRLVFFPMKPMPA